MNKHRTDLVSLVGGVIFLGVVGTWALERADLLGGLRGWLLPVLLIGVGLIGLIGIRPRRQEAQTRDSARSDWTADPAATDQSSTDESPTDKSAPDAAPAGTTAADRTSADDEVKDT